MCVGGPNRCRVSHQFPQVRWKTLGRAPEGMERGATAVDGNTVYVTPRYTHRVWAYDPKEDKWTRLPDCPQHDAGLAMVNGLLTVVGGSTSDCDATNTLASLNESRSKWTENFPPMPVKLYNPAAVCTGNHLVVVAHMETRVHVMNTTSLRWFFASSLPLFVFNPSLLVCETELYVLNYNGSVFSCSLPNLLQSSSAVQPETTDMWRNLSVAPVSDSTLAILCGQVLAVGGRYKLLDSIYLYNPSADSWHIIGHMPTARCDCLVATLPGDTLVVMGGLTGGRPCDVVEVVYPV